MAKLRNIQNGLTYASAAVGFVSVYEHMQLVFRVGFIGLYGLALYRDRDEAFTVPRWLVNVLSLLVLVFSTFRIRADYLIEPILEALLVLLAVKLLEVKQSRDYLQVYMLCMFLLVGSTLLTLSPIFLLFFILLCLLLTTSLMALAHGSENQDMILTRFHLAQMVRRSIAICAIAVPLSAAFFIVLPRTPYPMLTLFNRKVESRSGFTDKVSLGEVSEIQQDNSVVFRAEMQPVEEPMLFWRGIVLDEFNGISWKSGLRSQEGQPGAPAGVEVFQTIYLEPFNSRYLFALDKPVSISAPNMGAPRGLSYTLKEIPHRRLKYTAWSIPSVTLPETLAQTDPYLQLPAGYSPRIQELTRQTLRNVPAREQIERLYRFLKEGEYQYSLDELSVSANPLEDFLLEKKQGNCEYFASALAVMLRMSGIPSRLVGGYKGGQYNRAAGYYMVLQSNAHVWVEAYIGPRGWLRLDPTPTISVTPRKIDRQMWLARLRLALDTLNYYWNRLVISYDLSKQIALLRALHDGLTTPPIDWNMTASREAKYAAALFLALVLAVGTGTWLTRRPAIEKRLVTGFLKRLASQGYERAPHEGLEEFVSRIQREDLKAPCRTFVDDFQAIYYRDRHFTHEDVKRLHGMIRKIPGKGT